MVTVENSLRWVTDEDIEFVSKNARKADRIEWALMWPLEPVCIKEMLKYSVGTSSVSMAGCHRNTVMVLLGLTALPEDHKTANIWAIFTEEIEHLSVYRAWYQISRRMIPILGRRFNRLENVVHSKNTKAIKFLKHTGFTLSQNTRTIKGEEFYPFHVDL